jgi:hypothetical protein
MGITGWCSEILGDSTGFVNDDPELLAALQDAYDSPAVVAPGRDGARKVRKSSCKPFRAWYKGIWPSFFLPVAGLWACASAQQVQYAPPTTGQRSDAQRDALSVCLAQSTRNTMSELGQDRAARGTLQATGRPDSSRGCRTSWPSPGTTGSRDPSEGDRYRPRARLAFRPGQVAHLLQGPRNRLPSQQGPTPVPLARNLSGGKRAAFPAKPTRNSHMSPPRPLGRRGRAARQHGGGWR